MIIIWNEDVNTSKGAHSGLARFSYSWCILTRIGGWDTITRQGNPGFSHRIIYEVQRDTFIPVAVPNLNIMKDGIIDEN